VKCQEFGADSHLASCLQPEEVAYLAYTATSESYFIGASDMLDIRGQCDDCNFQQKYSKHNYIDSYTP
jgi:hypothetical protein